MIELANVAAQPQAALMVASIRRDMSAPLVGCSGVLAAHSLRSRRITPETGGPDGRSRRLAHTLTEHPGTEAEPPLVLVSPFVSVARGVAVASLVTRAVTRS